MLMRLQAIDEAPRPKVALYFCEEWEAECLADYLADCRACPEVQLPSYDEYRWGHDPSEADTRYQALALEVDWELRRLCGPAEVKLC